MAGGDALTLTSPPSIFGHCKTKPTSFPLPVEAITTEHTNAACRYATLSFFGDVVESISGLPATSSASTSPTVASTPPPNPALRYLHLLHSTITLNLCRPHPGPRLPYFLHSKSLPPLLPPLKSPVDPPRLTWKISPNAVGIMEEAFSITGDSDFSIPFTPIMPDNVLHDLSMVQHNVIPLQVGLYGRKVDKNVVHLTHVSQMGKNCESHSE